MDSQAVGRLTRATIVLGLSATYFSYVFQFSAGTFARSGLGDWLDPYFINLLMEHWYTSVVTLSDPSSLPIYYPVEGTLGWSHALVLFAPFYIAVRPFFDPFQAWTLALFAVMVIGSSCLYLMLRWIGLRFLDALLLAAFFATTPNVVSQFTSTFSQTASVFLVPMIGIVAMSAERARTHLRVPLAVLAGLLFSLLFAQEFYTGAFLVLVTALFVAGVLLDPGVRRPITTLGERPQEASRLPSRAWLIVAVLSAALAAAILVHPIERTEFGPWSVSARDSSRPWMVAILAASWYVFRRWRLHALPARFVANIRSAASRTVAGRWIAGHAAVLVGYVVGALLGAAVFLWIYLESFLTFREFPSEHLWDQLHQPDVSRWTGIADAWRDLWAYDSSRSVFLLIAVAALTWLPAVRHRSDLRRTAVWSLIVSAVVLALALRLGNFSPWSAFVGWVPGFAVIRDPSRIIYLYDLAVVIVVALLVRSASVAAFRVGVLVVVCALLAADWNTQVFNFRRPRAIFAAVVDAPIRVDPSCQSFFVRRASAAYESRYSNLWSVYAIDSAFIAVKYRLPTLNGYSAWLPDDWGLQEPQQPWYMKGVDEWITRHRLAHVCQLDIEARTMKPYAVGGM